MIDIRAALRTTLLADAAVSAIVTRATWSNIYPGILPQGKITDVTPALVDNLISEVTDYRMAGPTGLEQMRIQIDAWASTPDAAVALANAVKDVLSGFKDDVSFGSNSPQDVAQIQGIFVENARDDFDATMKLHRRSRDYIVWYREG